VPRRVTSQTSSLPKRETDICLRVKEARNVAGVSQEQLSAEIGIPRDRLSTYEKCRAPIKADLGLRICRQLIVSEEWLATGKTRMMETAARRQFPRSSSRGFGSLSWIFQRQCYDLHSEPISLGIPPGTLFSDAFDNHLAATYEALAKQCLYDPRIIFVDERQEPDLAARYIDIIFRRSMRLLEHEANRAGIGSWTVQRNFTRATFSFCHKAYREFLDLRFDVGGFQAFVSAVEKLQRQPRKRSAAAVKVA
jgi:transcriptional regulator with XRE-family HTH domain